VNTDRLFALRTSSTIDASGTGAVNFTSTGTMGFAATNGSRTLTLTGTNTGDNTIAAVINDRSGTDKTSLTKTGTGTWVLGGTNNYTGTTTVSDGVLRVNGSTAAGSAVTVEANGTLGGNGTVNGSLALTGNLAPGQSGVSIQTLNAGATTWNAGSEWQFDLASTGTSSDKLNITGDFIKGGTGSYIFDFMGSTPAWNTTFTLAQWSGSLTGFTVDDFDFINLGPGPYGASEFTIVDNTLRFTAIPEPGTALAGILLGLGLLRRRRA
jgi:fibronectin-binding autotransporter adhesin